MPCKQVGTHQSDGRLLQSTDGTHSRRRDITHGQLRQILAEGLADEYTRMGSVMEWDTAAGDALLRSLGMPLRSIETGEPLMYNKQVLRSSDFTVKNPAREL